MRARWKCFACRDHVWASWCYFGLLIGAGTLGWPYILSFWSFYSHTRPAERQMVTLLINMFLYWIGAFSKRESNSEGRRYPSAREPGVCSGGYQIPAMQHKPVLDSGSFRGKISSVSQLWFNWASSRTSGCLLHAAHAFIIIAYISCIKPQLLRRC